MKLETYHMQNGACLVHMINFGMTPFLTKPTTVMDKSGASLGEKKYITLTMKSRLLLIQLLIQKRNNEVNHIQHITKIIKPSAGNN